MCRLFIPLPSLRVCFSFSFPPAHLMSLPSCAPSQGTLRPLFTVKRLKMLDVVVGHRNLKVFAQAIHVGDAFTGAYLPCPATLLHPRVLPSAIR